MKYCYAACESYVEVVIGAKGNASSLSALSHRHAYAMYRFVYARRHAHLYAYKRIRVRIIHIQRHETITRSTVWYSAELQKREMKEKFLHTKHAWVYTERTEQQWPISPSHGQGSPVLSILSNSLSHSIHSLHVLSSHCDWRVIFVLSCSSLCVPSASSFSFFGMQSADNVTRYTHIHMQTQIQNKQIQAHIQQQQTSSKPASQPAAAAAAVVVVVVAVIVTITV